MAYARRVLRGTTFYKPEKAYNGYTLFTPMTAVPSETWLIDMEGHFVHHWTLPGWVRLRAHLLPNGHILFGLQNPDSPTASLPYAAEKLMELDWDGNVAWEYYEPKADCHDWIRRANGNTIIMKYIELPKEIAARVKGGVPGTEDNGVMLTYALQEITPAGEKVWEWLTYEHMDPEIDSLRVQAHRFIWPGWNSLVELPDENILACSYHTDNLVIIDKKTGDIKWRWGKGIMSYPHNPSMLDNGNILVLDNQRFHAHYWPPDYSRVIEVNPSTNEIEWEYQEENPVDFFTTYIGGCERLPNGNTLICEGAMGRFFEVTMNGEMVWEYVVPFYARREGAIYGLSNCTFRCHRYGPDYPGLQGRRLDPTALNTYNQLYGPGPVIARGGAIVADVPAAPAAAPAAPPAPAGPKPSARGHSAKLAERLKLLGY